MAREDDGEGSGFGKYIILGVVLLAGVGAYYAFSGKKEPVRQKAPPIVAAAVAAVVVAAPSRGIMHPRFRGLWPLVSPRMGVCRMRLAGSVSSSLSMRQGRRLRSFFKAVSVTSVIPLRCRTSFYTNATWTRRQMTPCARFMFNSAPPPPIDDDTSPSFLEAAPQPTLVW